MTRFKPESSGVGSDHSVNRVTTNASERAMLKWAWMFKLNCFIPFAFTVMQEQNQINQQFKINKDKYRSTVIRLELTKTNP